MRATVIDCASCGGPLGAALARAQGGLVPCLYCGALLRFSESAPEAAPTVERTLPADVIDRAREAALRGGRAEAIALVMRDGGVSEAAAALAVDDVIKNLGSKTVFSQTLNAFGWVLVFAGVACVLGGITILVWPTPARLLGVVFLGFGALNLFVLGRGVRKSIEFLFAARGVAVIRRSIEVGPTPFADGCRVYSLAVDVAPDAGGEPFHARLVVPVRPISVGKMEAGKKLGVRFRDGGAWLLPDGDRVVS